MSNGTTSKTLELFAKFSASVVAQLPRTLDERQILKWVGDPELLKALLYETLALGEGTRWPTVSSSLIFELEVNYDLSLEDLIRNGNFDYVEGSIANHPLKRRPSGLIEFHLLNFRGQKTLSWVEIISKLQDRGLRPAELIELLTFGAKFPDVQKYFSIYAMGSTTLSTHGVLVPELTYDQRPRVLVSHLWTNPGGPETKIAAVPIK